MISLKDEENEFHQNQKLGYICIKRFTNDNKKVNDHCHFTRKHRVATHNKCNMNYEI